MSIFFHYYRRFSSKLFVRAGKGFTLVELLVVSAIILLMTAFIFFQQSKFNSSTLLRSLTYSVALSVRQAQVYGTSVRESSVGSGVFSKGYGVYVPAVGTTANLYYIFADIDGDGAYDATEELPVFRLGAGYYLGSICFVVGSSGSCAATPTPNSLTVFFRRPNPDACLSNNADGACAVGATALYTKTFITIANTKNADTRSIKISDNGQISVCTPNLTGDALISGC